MDFADLSKYDDLCSDIFLDALFLWFKTSKMNTDHRRPRIPSSKVLEIIQRNILQERNPNDAIAELLEIDYFKHYITTKTIKQRQEFVQHMKRYLYMYMPNAGYEISDTRRYKDHGKKVEACLIATKDFHVGDELRLCTGMIANLNPSEDAMLRKGQKDFSIMWSTRKGCSCLFLGPARFVNHDCDSNCKFISLGQSSVTFKVVKEIRCGEELTVFYGNHYFGENNNECRCATCELQGEGYFSTYSATEETVDGRRRSSRKRKSALHDDYVTDHIPRAKRTNTGSATPNGERRNSASVMSIDFLCGREEQQQHQEQSSPLDLLCDAVLDAEYSKGNRSKALTVLVGPDRKDTSAVSISMYYQESSPLSDDMSSDTKADSAVGMSPHSHEGHWKEDDDEFDVDGLSDLLDDQSDLSSIGSSDLAAEWSDDDEEDDVSEDNIKPKGKSTTASEKLACIACKRELRREEISEQIGCDTSITADLVTWSWTPSALFTDWRPKRCPRCERHFTIFNQEWPNRKIKKKKKIQKPVEPQVKPKKTKKPKKKSTPPPLKIDTDIFNNDDLFSPLTPLSDFSGDEEELFKIPL
ncbi:hypothetical protein BJV82DRAFT_656721 [Fennellomyces sp. T-0311]|nr:hypothetical protein BJV82DRAFT_656721 [Fennellomyces sp. T-0311]